MADRNPVRGTRLPDGLDEQYEEYRDGHNMTDSEALRSLIRSGLAEREQEADGTTDGPTFWLMVSAVLAAAAVLGGVAGLLAFVMVSSVASLLFQLGIVAVALSVVSFLVATDTDGTTGQLEEVIRRLRP